MVHLQKAKKKKRANPDFNLRTSAHTIWSAALPQNTMQSPYCLRPGCEQPFSPSAMLNPATTLKSKSQIFIFRKKNNSFNCIAWKSWEKLIFQVNKCQISVTCTITQTSGLDFSPPSKQRLIITQSAEAHFHLYPPSSVLCALPSGHGGGLSNLSATDDRCGRRLRGSSASISNMP